jgi:hypothetical protein
MSVFCPPSSCFPLQLDVCSENAERTFLSWSWSVSGLLDPPPIPKKVGSSKTSLLMSCKHTLSQKKKKKKFTNLFTCETEQQQQQQQQQKLNFFEKIGGKNLSQFPTQVSQNQKK